jgi:hypothetical protein
LCFDVKLEVGYDETFSRAVGLISNLKTFNRAFVKDNLRRDAECDIWKMYAEEWHKVKGDPTDKRNFFQAHRNYDKIVKRLGPPDGGIQVEKKPNLINVYLLSSESKCMKTKRVPKRMKLQALKNLIPKLHNLSSNVDFKMFLLDKERSVKIELDNFTKSLDFYSIDDNDTVEFSVI